MKERKEKSRLPILAAGGIVLRHSLLPQFAIVQSRKMDTWGLPKGKLAAGEDAMTAARREVLEETGYHATIHEFLGTLAYETSGRPKVIQFWRMEAVGEPAGDLMHDVKAVRWLSLKDAINRLTHLREQMFLQQVAPIALQFAEAARRALSQGQSTDRDFAPDRVPLAPGSHVFLPGLADPYDVAASIPPGEDILALAGFSGQATEVHGAETAEKNLVEDTSIKKTLVKKTWGWFRHGAMHRQID